MTLTKFGVAILTAMSLTTGAILARPEVQLVVHGYVVHGSAQTPKLDEFSADVTPKPGDTIEWKVTASNPSGESVRDLVTNLPIAASTILIPGSPSGPTGVVVTYSADGGKTFSAKPVRAVRTPQGEVLKPVPTASYTTVRWVLPSALGPKSTESFTYEARVK